MGVKLEFNKEIAMTLEITMKPKKPVEEVFRSAKLIAHNNAKMFFSVWANCEVQIVTGQPGDSETKIQSTHGWFWDAKALRELASACHKIADILDRQNA